MSRPTSATTDNDKASNNNNGTTTTQAPPDLDIPESVEEAGALLGAAITRCGLSSLSVVSPPKGMHSSFGIVTPIPSSELFMRLQNLRALLRSSTKTGTDEHVPLPAAPSLLAVLMKLLGVSSSIGSSPQASSAGRTPPMISTPLRKLWVDCIVLCHRLGDGLAGNARIDIYAYVRTMMALAGTNPKSAKAAGGTRIAALDVMAGLFADDQLASKLAPWALDVLIVCHRGLKSSGNGEPTHRIACVQTAQSVAMACRLSGLKKAHEEGCTFIVRGGMEDRAIAEAVRLLRQAITDKYPEVRNEAAILAGMVAPVLLHNTPYPSNLSAGGGGSGGGKGGDNASSSPTASLDDVLMIALRNLDDESAGVAAEWSEALARLLCTSIEYGQVVRISVAAGRSDRNFDDQQQDGGSGGTNDSSGGGGGGSSSSKKAGSGGGTKYGGRKPSGMSDKCSSISNAAHHLVKHFVKAGGELSASRGGGSFSTGGRAVRIGVSLTLVKLFQLQSLQGHIGQGGGTGEMTMTEAIQAVLTMVGPEILKQLRLPENATQSSSTTLDATSAQFAAVTSEKSSSSLFSLPGRYKSHADAGLARLATSRVLRQGLSEMASEPTQLSILHDLVQMCPTAMSSLSSTATAADGGGTEKSSAEGSNNDNGEHEGVVLNPHQLQVVLIEISHLLTTLGEACASCIEDLSIALRACMIHSEHGVRHEAAIACAAMAGTFPREGRKIFLSSVNDLQLHYADLVTLDRTRMEDGDDNASGSDGKAQKKKKGSRFRRSLGGKAKEEKEDPSLSHQYAIHGLALLISMLLKELPRLPGGLPTKLLGTGLSVAEILVSCQYNNVMTKMNPGAACTCVRAGYGIVCGALTSGATAITPHIALIFGLWQKSSKSAESGAKHFTTDHDLICLDAALSSIVAFLANCSELLLAVPDALSRTALILEEILPLFLPEGRLGSKPQNPAAASRHESAKASIMEAFAWLPPGSFPMVADTLFTFAASHIQSGTEEEVMCSILSTLVSNEDHLLDAKSLIRAQRVVQVGGARDVEENLVALTSEAAHHGERESVLHFRRRRPPSASAVDADSKGSQILGLFAHDSGSSWAPTALHSVGKWREPIPPSHSSKVRLIDAAVQAFASTFSMKDSREQMSAMVMLEALVPPFLAQLARAIGVNTALTEPVRSSKAKEELAGVVNICAVVLACLEALPIHESTHNIRIGLGPPWMNKAKDLLLTLLPSTSNIVRRAAAEGLALLATLGVSEDAHTLQSAVLHSLDEVMQGNMPDGKPRALPLEPVSCARAGSVLTLACIQRTYKNIKRKQEEKSHGLSFDSQEELLDDTLPTMQMMTRLLPSLVCNGRVKDAFLVKTNALHAFGLLISYSANRSKFTMSDENQHLVRKLAEAVEDNFLSSWTAASTEFDGCQETEKLGGEPAFVAVLLRLMTFLLPSLPLLRESDPSLVFRFSGMAQIIMELYGFHPSVLMEGLAFFESLSNHKSLLPDASHSVIRSENLLTCCVPFLQNSISPNRPALLPEVGWKRSSGCLSSGVARRAAILCIQSMSQAGTLFSNGQETEIPSMLLALLEVACGSRLYGGAELYRSVAAPPGAENVSSDQLLVETEIVACLESMLLLESSAPANDAAKKLLHWILLSRSLLAGNAGKSSSDSIHFGDNRPLTVEGVVHTAASSAARSALLVLQHASPSRWQVKCQAAKSATFALEELAAICQIENVATKDSPYFNPIVAKKACQKNCAEKRGADLDVASFLDGPSSYAILHLREIATSACGSAVATLDHAELRLLQEGGLRFLNTVIKYICCIPDPEEKGVSILEQYSSQIYSSIKHALGSLDESDGGPSYRLFMAGCEALQVLAKEGLITDPMVMKRMVRPAIPSSEEIPFCSFKSKPADGKLRPEKPDSLDNHRSALLPRIGKVWTVSKLQTLVDKSTLAEPVSGPINAFTKDLKKEIGAHSAAIALDGARLLKGNKLTLCGSSNTQSGLTDVPFEAGLMYSNIQNIDDVTKASIVQAWPSCASSAVSFLLNAMNNKEADKDVISDCQLWLEQLVPVIFTGLIESLEEIEAGDFRDSPVTWARGLSREDIAESCLHGISTLVKSGNKAIPGEEQLGLALDLVLNIIFLPTIGLDPFASDEDNVGGKTSSYSRRSGLNAESKDLVNEACSFLTSLSFASKESSTHVLNAALKPLDAMQNQSVKLDDLYTTTILQSCLKSMHHLITKPSAGKSLVQAMLQLILEVLSSPSKYPQGLHDLSTALLRDCLSHESISTAEQRSLAQKMAQEENWDAWIILCTRLEDGSGVRHSLDYLRGSLEDVNNLKRNAAALGAVRAVAQTAAAVSPIVGNILHGGGAQILLLLKTHGTCPPSPGKEDRMAAFADCMKIIMVAFQHLTSVGQGEQEQQQLTAFLVLLFEVLIDIIMFNGLPNYPPREGDPALGRMCAAGAVHVARTSPACFKTSMTGLSDQGRAVLEMAVRAEMTGYAAQPQAPTKKKLSLKGFKK